MSRRKWNAFGWVVAAVLVGGCGPFGGGGDGSAIVVPPEQRMSMGDSLLVLVPIRPEEEIRKDLDDVAERRAIADEAEREAKLLQARAETQINVKEAEIKSHEANLKIAEQQKDEVAASQWRGRRQLANLEKKLLEQREKLRSGEIELAHAQRDHLDALKESLETELELQDKYEQRSQFAGREQTPEVLAGMARYDAEVESLEKRALEKRLASTRKRQRVANQEAELLEQRLKVLDAQTSLSHGQ